MNRTPFFEGYLRSLKDPCAEEIIDLAVFRPLGFLCVKIFLPFPVTPNHVSLMAMIVGIAAGFSLARGSHHAFLVGGILYGLSNILDCCDGMLARIKKNGTATGRIVDGVVDYITGAAVLAGLGIGLTKAVHLGTLHLPLNGWLLVVLAAASTALHAVLSDYYRNTYLDRGRKPSESIESEREKYREELSRLNAERGHAIDNLLVRVYLGYLRLQSGKNQEERAKAGIQPPAIVTPLKVMLWNCIGPSTHITFFILGAILFRPEIYFFFVVILANVWTAALCATRIFEKDRFFPRQET